MLTDLCMKSSGFLHNIFSDYYLPKIYNIHFYLALKPLFFYICFCVFVLFYRFNSVMNSPIIFKSVNSSSFNSMG